VAALLLEAPQKGLGVAGAVLSALPVAAAVTEGEPEVLALADRLADWVAEATRDAVGRMEVVLVVVLQPVVDCVSVGEREVDGQDVALEDRLPPASEGLAVDSRPLSLGLELGLREKLAVPLPEGEREGRWGVAVGSRVAAAL
jgi:hypothetical protein